jgi:predicted nucleic acid-binding protein
VITMSCVIDSGVWIAAFNKKDVHHQQGRLIISAVTDGKLVEPRITDYIFNEVVTYTRKKLGFEVSLKIANALLDSSHVKMLVVDESMFMSSFHIFQKYDALSFTDANIVVVMKNLRLKWLYSFDSGFDGVKKITRLESLADT